MKLIHKFSDVWLVLMILSGCSLSAMAKSHMDYNYELINLCVFTIFTLLYLFGSSKPIK